MIPEPDEAAVSHFTELAMANLDDHAAREAETDPAFQAAWARMRPHAEKLVRAHVTKQIARCIAQHEARHATIN
jgi:hypothetical protein